MCEEARHWLLLSWLIAVDKGNNKIRPIAGGTVFVKLAATYLMENLEQTKNIFRESGVQCGVFMPDGATVARNFTQIALEANPGSVVIKVDFKNAFNTLSRKNMLTYLFQEPRLLPLYRLASWIYGRPSTLLVRNRAGRPVESIPSMQGVRQGCVLGSLLFAIATKRMLSDVKTHFPEIEVLAYLDDVILVEKPDRCLDALDQLAKDAADLLLTVQTDKCEVLVSPSIDPDTQNALFHRGLELVQNSLPLLGSVVGIEHDHLRNWAEEEVQSWQKTLSMMARKELPVQLSLLLTRWTLTAKPNFMARTLPPGLTLNALKRLDKAVIETIQNRTQLRFEDFALKLLQLPTRHGGAGFCPSADTAPHAFVAGMAATLSGFMGHSNLLHSKAWHDFKDIPSFKAWTPFSENRTLRRTSGFWAKEI